MEILPGSKSGRPTQDIAIYIIREAGNLALSRFDGEKKVTSKGRGNIVTDVDKACEELIKSSLRREYPSFGIMAEESAPTNGDSGYVWIADPLDGTRNYASGIPHFCVTLALARGDDVVLGLIYDPVRKELFRAVKGGGAFLNDSPIHVSKKQTVQDSVVGIDMGYDDEMGRDALKLLLALWPGMQSIRIMGSAALGLAYTACGRLDLYAHHLLYPWDLASGLLLIREAGGVVTRKDGSEARYSNRDVIVSNRDIHGDFMQRTVGLEWRRHGHSDI